jgi:hypothetical protein
MAGCLVRVGCGNAKQPACGLIQPPPDQSVGTGRHRFARHPSLIRGEFLAASPFRPLKGIPGQNSQYKPSGRRLYLYSALVSPFVSSRSFVREGAAQMFGRCKITNSRASPALRFAGAPSPSQAIERELFPIFQSSEQL